MNKPIYRNCAMCGKSLDRNHRRFCSRQCEADMARETRLLKCRICRRLVMKKDMALHLRVAHGIKRVNAV